MGIRNYSTNCINIANYFPDIKVWHLIHLLLKCFGLSVCAQLFYSLWKTKINVSVFFDLFIFTSHDFALSFSDTLM